MGKTEEKSAGRTCIWPSACRGIAKPSHRFKGKYSDPVYRSQYGRPGHKKSLHRIKAESCLEGPGHKDTLNLFLRNTAPGCCVGPDTQQNAADLAG